MPTHEQLLREEQDLFQKLETGRESAQRAAATADQRAAEQQRREAAEQPVLHESVAPSVVAELPKHTIASREAAARLFGHFSERLRNSELTQEEEEHHSATQTDPRTTAQSREPQGRLQRENERADEFEDGIVADFVTDSQISAAAMDEGPHGVAAQADGFDAWEGAPTRRRRRLGSSPAAKPTKREEKP